MSERIKCDKCGRFVGVKDLESGSAIRYLVTPDSHLTREEYETMCGACIGDLADTGEGETVWTVDAEERAKAFAEHCEGWGL